MANAIGSASPAHSPPRLDDHTLSSAVLLPESEATDGISTPTGASKRRQPSSSLSPHAKRARLATSQPPTGSTTVTPVVQEPTPAPSSTSTSSKHDQQTSNLDLQTLPSPTSATQDTEAKPPIRRPTGPRVLPDQDKGRNKRLFGSLLGTLAQPSRTTSSKRKEDIERKQASKLRQRDEELEAAKQHREREAQVRREEEAARRSLLEERRREQQRVWDLQSRRIRQGNRRAMANFLETEAEPRVHWRPFELLPRQEERIREQVEEVEAEIKAELDEGDAERPRMNGLEDEGGVNVSGDTEPHPDPQTAQQSALPAGEQDLNAMPGQVKTASQALPTPETTHPEQAGNDPPRLEENGEDHENDEIANAGEDAVIY